jgi:hypothetical protein
MAQGAKLRDTNKTTNLTPGYKSYKNNQPQITRLARCCMASICSGVVDLKSSMAQAVVYKPP